MIALSFSKGDSFDALHHIRHLESINKQCNLPYFIVLPALIWKARILIEKGNITDAKMELNKVGIMEGNNISDGQGAGYLVLSRALLADSTYSYTNICTLLDELIERLALSGEKKLLAEAYLIKSRADENAGKTSNAEINLINALHIGVECDFFQIYIDEGKHLYPVLFRLTKEDYNGELNITSDVLALAIRINKLLKQDDKIALSIEERKTTKKSNSYKILIEDLSKRELEILELISKGHSNQDIAEKLYLSLGTVKWHTSNIYGKLGVSNRTHAVTIANEFNIF